MTDSRTKQLVGASFRGVPFQIFTETLSEGGRKIVLHEYVNSSERFVEDLGEIPPRFRISAFVHGNNFKSLSQRLESALNQEGEGKLFLPTFGGVDVYALPYTKDASQKAVGEIKFELEFAVGRPAAGPVVSTIDVEQVYSLGDTARQKIQAALGALFQVPVQSENVTVASFDITASMDGLLENYKDILPSENLTGIESKIDRIKAALPQLIRDPELLSAQLIGGTPSDPALWQNVSLGLTGGSGITNLILSTVFGTGDLLNLSDINGSSADNNPISDIPLWAETTAERIKRNDNRLNIVNAHRVSAMVGAYESVAAASYNTQNEIIAAREAVEDIHDRLMLDDTFDRNVVQSEDDARSAIESVRLASLNVLEQKEQEVYSLAEARILSPSSSFVQAYNFYAEEFTNDLELSDKAILLRKLNPSLPAISLENDVTIFRTA